MIEAAATTQIDYLLAKPEAEKKALGQYYTGSKVAEYMASMIEPVQAEKVRILDAGAGAGILAVCAALQCLENGNDAVHAVLYELDENAIPLLRENMQSVQEHFLNNGGTFTYDIRVKDFVLARPDLRGERFHISSINPPYFKINAKTSPYADATGDLYKGNPNIYASFMAIVGACLEPGGQMVAIVPRSFANGLYFRGFRNYLLKTLSLDKIHIFKARNKVFKEQSVLQENVICSFSKNKQIEEITIRTSEGHVDLVDANQEIYASELILDKNGGHEIIRIPESAEDAQILKAVESWPSSFTSNGYFISTGPVVEHRTREYISKYEKGMNAVPLIRMHNVKPFQTKWTPDGVKNACFLLQNGFNKHVSSNSPYVLLKRFSSKDEKRRLVAGVHNPSMWDGDLIALENHLNYIGIKDETFELREAFGLAALFNSTFIDKYFRCISGNTQVNATEMRMLKLPTQDVIKLIGIDVAKLSEYTQEAIDTCVNEHLKRYAE